MAKLNLGFLKNKQFLALAGNAVISLLSLVQMGLIYRKLETSEVGGWTIFLVTLGIAESLRNGFLATATIKFYAGTGKDRAAEVLGSVWFIALVITGVLLLVNLALVPFENYFSDVDIRVMIKWLGLTFLSSLPYTLYFWVLTADERYEKILWMRMVNNGSMIICVICWVIFYKLSLEAMLWINFLTNILTDVVGLFFGMAHLKTIPKRTKQCIIEIFHFGKFSMGSNLLSNMLRNTDIYIIRAVLGEAAVAIYNIPVKLLEIVEIPLRSFIMTGMSGMAIAFNQNNKERVKYILTKYSGMLTIAFIPLALGALVFADLIVYLMYGTKYVGTEGANLFRFFMVFSVMYPVDRFCGATLDVMHKPRINLYKVVVMLVVNLVTDLVGVYIFRNIYGIVAGSFFTIFAGILYGYYNLRRYLPYTIAGTLSTGYVELRWLLQRKLAFLGRRDKNAG